MPYVITTNEPFDAAVHTKRPAFTRRAVATIDEMREAVRLVVIDRMLLDDMIVATRDVPASGGTVGPLPDGTVIEVAPALLSEVIAAVPLAVRVEWPETMPADAIIDAYNAAQEA